MNEREPIHQTATVEASPTDGMLIGLRGIARLTGDTIAYDTLKKHHKTMLPSPHVTRHDRLRRPNRVFWLTRKIVAWIDAGMPSDVVAFDARWAKQQRKS